MFSCRTTPLVGEEFSQNFVVPPSFHQDSKAAASHSSETVQYRGVWFYARFGARP
jgi:hypothetical protein